MKDIEKLPIDTDFDSENLPKELTISSDMVNINSIKLPDDLFDINTPYSNIGLLELFLPVIVVQNQKKNYTIVDGCKRYMHYRKTGKNNIDCKIIQTPLTEFSSGLLRIAINKNRPQHLREKHTIFAWLKNRCTKDNFEVIANKAGFSLKDIEQLTQILLFEDQVKEAVLSGSLYPALAKDFQIFSPKDQISFLYILKNLSLSFQTQREFIEWLPEIAYINNTTITKILEKPQIQETVYSTNLNAPQKIEKIRSLLYDQKFPRLSDALKIWKKYAAELNPDPSFIKFIRDPYFEKNLFEMNISITDPKKAVNIFKKLNKISLNKWQKLIYPL